MEAVLINDGFVSMMSIQLDRFKEFLGTTITSEGRSEWLDIIRQMDDFILKMEKGENVID
ncbi:TPA_asm: hypothetical protein [Altiarchaeum virus]|nr:TPA_asm: hypothetical protein [Altiarchaeum virus]